MSKTQEIKSLITERDEIDRQIEEQLLILEANNCTMENSLVDEEGYPIASIDVYNVRHARTAIIRLRNDRVALMEKVAEAIVDDSVLGEGNKILSMEVDGNAPTVHRTSNTPFAKVTSVVPESPAAIDGFKENDEIIQYGPIHHGNFINMQEFSEVTNNNQGSIIRVTVIRNLRPVRLEIRPRQWNGKGLLGCAVVPISA